MLRKLLATMAATAAAGVVLLRGRSGRRAIDVAVEQIREDVRAVKERDPAATSTLEVLTSYSGLHALWMHRLAHWLDAGGLRLLARWVSQFNRLVTQVEIHPSAKIGKGLFIDHGSGVVIGETTEIGDNVTLYQGVTLGGTGKETGKRHPTLGDNVIVGAGAKVLGSVTVGDDAKIGAGSVVVLDVPRDSTVVGNPGRPVLLQGQKVGIPDIDYRHLPDPVAEAVKCLVARIVEMEKELEELHPGREAQREAALAETQRVLRDLLHFESGLGI